MRNLICSLRVLNSISIIGMAKNVGKTTTLNFLIQEAKGKLTLGLTSIGRDGEIEDTVTLTPKPQIYIHKGSIIATAKSCFLSSDITKEIIWTTGISSPMGEIVIFKALSDGFVQLAGPSSNYYLEKIGKKLKEAGSDIVIADGAISRKSLASPRVTEGTILCTGASYSKDMNKVVGDTAHVVRLLTLENEKNRGVIKLSNRILDDSRIGIIDAGNKVKKLNVLTSLEASKEVIEHLDRNSKYLVIKGVVGNKLLQDIMQGTNHYKDVTFLAEDGTKLFVDKATLDKFEKCGGKLKVLYPTNLVCITANPTSPYGYSFNKERFLAQLRKEIPLPVFDVMGGEYD